METRDRGVITWNVGEIEWMVWGWISCSISALFKMAPFLTVLYIPTLRSCVAQSYRLQDLFSNLY